MGQWRGRPDRPDRHAQPPAATRRGRSSDKASIFRPFATRSKTLWPPGRSPGTKLESGYSRQQFEAAWASIANQAPHRHRQANSGTCRGREPPHARHTFEVLPPETSPHKNDLSGYVPPSCSERLRHGQIEKSAASTPDLAAIHFFCWTGLAVWRCRDTCGWLSLDAPHGNSARWHQPTHSKRAAVVQGYADGRTTTGN